jgi:hypothetical protein
MAQVAAPWVRGGAAVLSIDFPLHGERVSAKLSGLLHEGLGLGGRASALGRRVLEEFVRQAVVDLQRALDAASRLPELDAKRTVYAGLSLGSIVGATYLGVDPRPRAAALALGGGGFGGPLADPCAHVARFAPRPLLFGAARRHRGALRSGGRPQGDPVVRRGPPGPAGPRPEGHVALPATPSRPRGRSLTCFHRPRGVAAGLPRWFRRRLRLRALREGAGAGRATFPPPPARAWPGSSTPEC